MPRVQPNPGRWRRRRWGLLAQNLDAAAQNELPICQDTGMACVFIELGQDVHISGDLQVAVDEGVRRGYAEGYLRKSITGDPLQRKNTDDNTPAFLTVTLVPGDACRITVAPKGAGSENMSRLAMLKPADGVQGVKDFVLETVRLAGSNPCPPIVLGVGIGGSFDKCAALAKHALLRPLDTPNPDPYYAALERELLQTVNAMGIGPQGFGGGDDLPWRIHRAGAHACGLPAGGGQRQLPCDPPGHRDAVNTKNEQEKEVDQLCLLKIPVSTFLWKASAFRRRKNAAWWISVGEDRPFRGGDIGDAQLEQMVNRHHQEVKEQHRRARQGG